MKNLKRLTRQQKIAVSIAGYLPDSWRLEKETEFYLKIVHKKFSVKRTIDKYAIPRKGKLKMNLETVTIEDCIENYGRKKQSAILDNGRIIGFTEETLKYNTIKEEELPIYHGFTKSSN